MMQTTKPQDCTETQIIGSILVWKNIKTGGLYVVDKGVINATNCVSGQVMIEYHSIEGECTYYVREKKEFFAKFSPYAYTSNISSKKATGGYSVVVSLNT